MFGIGSTELVIILIVALVLIGPSKLPDLMKSVGKGLSEFRRMSTDVKSTLEREIEKADEAKRIEETRKELFGDDAKSGADADKAAKADAAQAQNAPSGNVSADAGLQKEVAPVTSDAAKPESQAAPVAAADAAKPATAQADGEAAKPATAHGAPDAAKPAEAQAPAEPATAQADGAALKAEAAQAAPAAKEHGRA